MRHQEFPGGFYVDALPTGERCVLFKGDGVDTHRGRLPLPAGETFGVLFLAITNVGNFAFAGQAHDTLNPAAHEWIEGTGWRLLPPPACGTNPLIYDNAGALHRSDCSIGSQGYRYVALDGRLMTGDETIKREVAPGILIHEFTDVLELTIGQGHESGVRVWDGKLLRLLHPGACFNIRVHRLGNAVTVAFYEVAPDGLSAHIYDLSLDELRALSVEGEIPATPPVPVPVPTPPATPKEPVPMSGITDAQFATLQRERAKFPTDRPLTGDEIGTILNSTAWAHRDELGLQRKDGNTTVQPKTRIPVWNGLWIKRGGQDFGQDVLGSASVGIATPVRGEVYVGQPTVFQFIPPVEPIGVVETPGTPTQPAPTTPTGTFASSGAVLDAKFAVMETRIVALTAALAALTETVANIKPAAPASSPAPDINGMRISLKTDNGHFVCAEGGGGQAINATRDSAGGWETFTVVTQ